MSPRPPIPGEVLDGPTRAGAELRWRVRRPDGGVVWAFALLPELARDEAVRRRYLRDVARLRDLEVEGLCPTLDWGPRDPADPATPFRVRAEVPGELLARWLDRRAPAPVDEVAVWGARLADVLGRLHARGFVVRGLAPHHVVLADAGVVLVDVGLSRVERLSTRTAASLLLEGSPYTAPEQLVRAMVDPRADVYALAALLWHGLLGEPPHAGTHALLREGAALPDPRKLRRDLAEPLAELLTRCLADDPDARPATVAEVGRALRGGGALAPALEHTTCQACGARMWVGQRLCVSCGREAVVFRRSAPCEGVSVVLEEIKEDAEALHSLREILESVTDEAVPPLNFLIGDTRMYSKRERNEYLPLPHKLLDDVEPASAEALVARMKERGLKVRAVPSAGVKLGDHLLRVAPWVLGGSVPLFVLALVMTKSVSGLVLAVPVLALLLIAIIVGARGSRDRRIALSPELVALRPAPAALPASDPLVRRLGALLTDGVASDVRERVGELALWVQRLVDHRARLADAGARAEAGLADPLVESLVARIEDEVRALVALDRRLAELEEGALVRDLARHRARAEGAEVTRTLARLDRAGELEARRAAAFARLLEAGALLRRAVELGLSVRDEQADHDRAVQAALAALGTGEDDGPE